MGSLSDPSLLSVALTLQSSSPGRDRDKPLPLPTEGPGLLAPLLLNRCHGNLIALSGGVDEN